MQVPEGWKKSTTGKLCTSIVPGRNKPRSFTGNIPWVTTPDINRRYIPGPNQSLHVSAEEVKKCGGKVVPTGCVIIAAVGDLGLVAINKEPIILNQQLHAFICKKENIEAEFLAYWLETQKGYMISRASQTTIPYLNKSNCESIPVLLPPLLEQQKIAQILSTWDQAITTTEQLLANSQHQKKALMQQLLTGKKRLLDDKGQMFSEEWEIFLLKEAAIIVMGASPKSLAYNENGDGLPLIQGNADIENKTSAPRLFTTEITRVCQAGDILLSVRAPVGTVAKSKHHACIGRGISAIQAKQNIENNFLYQWMLWFESRWQTYAQGSTFESINSDDIKNLKLKIPSLEEQQKIAIVLTAADKKITTLEQKIGQLKQEKKALMQQLLTGKKRVKLYV